MEPQTAVKATRRNFWLSILNGALMIGTTNSIASPELVLTAFAAYLTSNPLILGAIAPIQNATWALPQIWTIPYVQRARHALRIYNYAAFLRLIGWATLTLTVLFVRDTTLLLLIVFAFVLIGGTAAGVAGLPFIEVIGKIIPARQRGLVFGWRGAIGGVLAIFGSQIVLFFTGPSAIFDFPTNYGLLFLVAGVLQTAGFFVFSLVHEPETKPTSTSTRPSFGIIRIIWTGDANFRHYVWGRTLFELSSVANALILVYASLRLGVRLELAGAYLLISSVLRPVFSIGAGWFSVRLGNRIPVAIGLLAQALGWALLILAPVFGVSGRAAEYYLIPIYSLTAIQKGLIFSNLMALGLNVTPNDQRAVYMGALNTWLGLIIFSGILSGVIVKTIGYQALFGLSLIMSCWSAWHFWKLRENLDES